MPTDWEAQYQRGETPWDKGAPHPALIDWLETSRPHGPVLVPGCGVGHDVRALAATGVDVTGIDLAPSAIRNAAAYPRAAGERYEIADLFALPGHLKNAFALVWEHTCFCAIEPHLRPAYVDAIYGALRPDGRLLAVFYLDPGNDSPDEGPPFEVSIAELDRLFAPRFSLIREWLPLHTYPNRAGREWMRLLRRIG